MQEARAAERKEPCCTRKIRTFRPIAKVHMQAFFVPLFLAESYSASRTPPYAERRREEEHPDPIDTFTISPRNRRDSADSVKSRLLRDDGSVVEKETLQHVFKYPEQGPTPPCFWWDSLRIGKRCTWLRLKGLEESTKPLFKTRAFLHLDNRQASTLVATGEASKAHIRYSSSYQLSASL
jgi:hypothetical protein